MIMDKRIEEKDRLGEGEPQGGDIGTASDSRQQQQGDPAGADIGVGGQRHEAGSSRDPQSQGRRTEEERNG
jgi:hypothetical protein